MARGLVGTIANHLGFILQFNGAVTVAPLALAFALNETQAFQGLTIAAILYLVLGFGLSHAPRGDLNFASISTLAVLNFVITAFVGAIPYVVMRDLFFPNADSLQVFLGAVFESASGYTTTGLTTIANIQTAPQSVLFFRSLTQWVGGISIVFLLLLFLISPGKGSKDMMHFSGFERLKPSARGTFIEALKIYAIYTVLFGVAFALLSGLDVLASVNLILSTVSTGGFIPFDNLDKVMGNSGAFVLVGLMVLGATNFSVPYKAFRRRALGTSGLEFLVFLVILAASILIVLAASLLQVEGRSIFDLAFLAISAVTTTGLQPLNLESLNQPQKIALLVSMFIGGMSFSTAGGMKIFRALIISRSFLWSARKLTAPPEAILPLKIGPSRILERDMILSFVMLGLAVFTIVLFAFIFTLHGYPFIDSLFEVTSAFATTGLSTGLTSISLQPLLQILLIFEMILGRIEVLPFLVFIRAIIGR